MTDPRMDEFSKAMKAFLALPLEEQQARLKKASEEACRINDEFNRNLRVDPLWLIQPMTL